MSRPDSSRGSVLRAGRFTLVTVTPLLNEGYVTSWETWEQAETAFDDGRLPLGFKLYDNETGRVWHPGTRYEWEAAQT